MTNDDFIETPRAWDDLRDSTKMAISQHFDEVCYLCNRPIPAEDFMANRVVTGLDSKPVHADCWD